MKDIILKTLALDLIAVFFIVMMGIFFPIPYWAYMGLGAIAGVGIAIIYMNPAIREHYEKEDK